VNLQLQNFTVTIELIQSFCYLWLKYLKYVHIQIRDIVLKNFTVTIKQI
jgi:hypothetical protein